MKRVLAALLALCLCLALCACGLGKKDVAPEPVETPEEPLPTVEPVVPVTPVPVTPPPATSEDVKLYAFAMTNGHKYVVNDCGQYSDEFTFDKEGNIVDEEGTMVVMAPNVALYRPIRTMYFSQDRYTLVAEGTTNESNELSSTQLYSNCVIELYCAPASATSGVICVRSDSNAVIEIRPNSNAKFVTIEGQKMEENEIALKADNLALPVQIFVRVLTNLSREATIKARTLDGVSAAECVVTVELTEARQVPRTPATTNFGNGGTGGTGGTGGNLPFVSPSPSPSPAIAPIQNATSVVNASGDPTRHTHSFVKNVIPPTTSSMGYTIYTCSVCGDTYIDDYVSKLPPDTPAPAPHSHHYVSVMMAPTETEQGYTLFVCDVCGDNYKTNFVPAMGQ